ncbi:MAG: pilin [Candidatus Jorgensenbacteria bacterium]|nr:pilin [Candidatus Jorgensenbacteria bacterium]
MKKYLFIALAYFLPFVAGAQNIWAGATCSSNPNAPKITTGGPTGPCSFCDGIIVTSNIINYMVQIAILVTIVMIVYGAILMMTSAGDTSRFGSGRSKITSAIIGLVIVVLAWLLVNEVFHILTGGANVPWSQVRCE